MLIPAIVAAGIYGYYRFQKYKEAKALDVLLPSPAVTPPGYAPSTPAMARAIAPAVKASMPTRTFAQNLFAAVQAVKPSPTEIPSSRIPSSAYGTASPPSPVPATPPAYSASGSIQIKL
jgi:hypothetical protein